MSIQIHPYTFILSLYGQYVLPRGEEIWIGSIIRALGALDFSAGAVRTLVSRMQRGGYLQSERVGRRSFYRLTDLGLKEVGWGSKRAFTPPDDEWDRQWTIVAYSVPEKHRKRRDALRQSLNGLGFGPLAPGTFLSPHPLPPEAEGKWRKYEVWEYLEVFRAQHLGPSNTLALVSRAWPQLPELKDRYQSYIAGYEPILGRFEAGDLDDESCFAARLRSLADFIAITLQDPNLPPALLPADWPRPVAKLLFKELQQALTEPAASFFGTIYETKGESDDQRT